MSEAAPAPAAGIPRSLFVFATLYGGMTCVAGFLGNKQIALGPLAMEAGIFAFLQLVVLSSAVAELHGRATADRLVRFGFVPLAMSAALCALVWALPASPGMDPARLTAIESILGQSPRLMVAGMIAYGISQTLNVHVFDALRRGNAGPLWLRGAIAGMLSQLLDTSIFITLAFAGTFPIGPLLIGHLIAKLTLSALLVPWLIQLAVSLGRRLDA